MPQVFMGQTRLISGNMRPGPERVAYLRGMVQHLNELLVQSDPNLLHARDLLKLIPQGAELAEIVDGPEGPRARLKPWAVDYVNFDIEKLQITIFDGRTRVGSHRKMIPTGPATPAFAEVIAALFHGATQEEIEEIGGRVDLDVEPLLAALLERQMVEELPERIDKVPARFKAGEGDRLTWLGHAAVMLQSGGGTVWVDPFLAPRVAFRPDEVPLAFAPEHAESRLFKRYDPEHAQLSIHELPTPDAVLITHQDNDHFDPGVLMTVPRNVPIVVPEWSGNPWDVDLGKVVDEVLGNRPVVYLKHGQHLQVGGLKITALPFRGEFPNVLHHLWNCYLVETDRSAVMCAADSRLDDPEVEELIRRLEGRERPLTLLAQPLFREDVKPGWREGPDQLWNFVRLHGWYAPLWSMFAPTRVSTVSYDQLRKLAARAHLRGFFPYALGSTPWFRLPVPIQFALRNTSLEELSTIEAELQNVPQVIRLPLYYGEPYRVDLDPSGNR
jgi:L-ascorbate metabolism protein UlaG (beta-lactamase superfamily)